MGASPETLQKQEYAHSSTTLYEWAGARALNNEVFLQNYEDLAYDDYKSALREMLRTAEGFSDVLDLDDTREHPIIKDKACNTAGKPMVEVLERGYRSSAALAEDYEEYEAQAIRDEGDVITAEIVDKLKPGQTYFAASVQPIEQLQDPQLRKLYKSLGYRDELLFIQSYSKTHDSKVVAGSYSIDKCEEADIRRLLAEKGVQIPDGEDPNKFIRYGFEATATPNEAEQIVKDMRSDHYASKGMTAKRYSVSEFVAQHEAVARQFFDTYYPSLADAVYSGQNNYVLQSFARTVQHADIANLKEDIKQDLAKTAESQTFDPAWKKNIDSVILYSVVEELRKGLSSFTGRIIKTYKEQGIEWRPGVYSSPTIPGVDVNFTNRLLTYNLNSGVVAGRSYGGCAAVSVSIKSAGEDPFDFNNINKQMAYGGESTSSSTSKKDESGDCEFISESCPECGTKNVKTTVKKINGRKHVEGKCGCSKTYN